MITDTATIHAEAWKEMFDAFLDEQADDYDPLDIEKDYFEFIVGKPRYDGVQSFLESRGIDLPQGKASDKPGKKTICGLGNRKNKIYQKLLEEDGFTVLAEVEENLKKWRAKGTKTAVVSSRKNCKKILDLANLNYLFDVRIDRVVREKLNLKGKSRTQLLMAVAVFAYALAIHEGLKTFHKVPTKTYSDGSQAKAESIFRLGINKLAAIATSLVDFIGYLSEEIRTQISKYRSPKAIFV